MPNKKNFYLFLILIIGIIFRLWFLDKPQGMWNDEYVGWYIASADNIDIFIKRIIDNCHVPFYFIYLKIWMLLFRDSDLSLRYSSVLPSVISIFTMYLAGRELKNEKTGYIAAFLTAISSFCIYFAQEIRLYSLIFLITSLIVLFFIKSINNPSKKNISIFLSLNALLIFTHTLGIIFSLFIISALFALLKTENCKNFDKKIFYKLLLCLFGFLICVSPLLINIGLSKNLSQFWSNFSFLKIFLTLTDYFSPIQLNIINTSSSVSKYLENSFVIFGIIPLSIAINSIVNAYNERNTKLNYLLYAGVSFFFVLILFSMSGKMVLITKYSIEIYPVLLLMLSSGFEKISSKKSGIILICTFLILNLSYLLFSNTSAPKLIRTEGNNIVVQLLKNSGLKNGDTVVLTYYDKEKFTKYLDEDTDFNFLSINKFNFNYTVFNDENYFNTIKNGKVLYRKLLKEFPNSNIQKFSYDNLITKTKKGDKIGLVFLDSVAFLNRETILDIEEDDILYNQVPFIFLVFSSLKNNLLFSLKDEFKIYRVTQSGDWTLFVYEKI